MHVLYGVMLGISIGVYLSGLDICTDSVLGLKNLVCLSFQLNDVKSVPNTDGPFGSGD
jgi:hypothetical protein